MIPVADPCETGEYELIMRVIYEKGGRKPREMRIRVTAD
jgi:hypothetical protein